MTALKEHPQTLLRRVIGSVALAFALSSVYLVAHAESAVKAEAEQAETATDNPKDLPPADEQWSVHGQSTYVSFWKNNFSSPNPGPKSLLNNTQGDQIKSYTWTITPFLGARLWPGAEIYYNPEGSQGIPFSGLAGLGGFPNGELQKGSAVPMIWYNARAFLRQNIRLGGPTQYVEAGPNQLAGNLDTHRITLTAGWLSVLDLFDANAYSHDPRTQFLNWSIMANGAFDYAANARGYTYGLAAEYFYQRMALRIARFAMPSEPNGLPLDYQLTKQYGDQLELEIGHDLLPQPGKLRFLLYRNRGWMASYADAVKMNPDAPSIFDDRNRYRIRWGYGINLEQGLTEDIGAFLRWGWNNGETETQAFTDIDRTLSGGLAIKGGSWKRPDDTLGLGFAVNGITASQINYLSRRGSTVFIGDGSLQYQGEKVFESYYSARLFKGASLSLDYQFIQNPAYNATRGPVNFFGVRAHYEF